MHEGRFESGPRAFLGFVSRRWPAGCYEKEASENEQPPRSIKKRRSLMVVSEIMTNKPIAAELGWTVRDALRTFHEQDFRF